MGKVERTVEVHPRHARPRQRYSTMPLTYGMEYRQIVKELLLCAALVCAFIAIIHGVALLVSITGWHGVF